MARELQDFDGTFFRGAKSDSDPGQLPLGYYFSGFNVINQGGVIATRPGYRCIVTLPGAGTATATTSSDGSTLSFSGDAGKLQGGAIYRPKIGLEQMIVVIDGRAFIAPWPFVSFTQLVNIQFSPSAKQVFFEMTEQSARRLSETQDSAIEVIAPKSVMFMQDGGETAPAYYDGSQAEHIRDRPFETPVGGPMKWIGDRLWVATGSFVRASDIANPFSFREEIYLGGTTAFSFASEVTALAATPSLEFPQLLVFTEQNCSIIQANIRVREQWLTTPDMQREIFGVGATGQRSITTHYGQLMWFSPDGVVFFDSAAQSKQSARMPIRDNEMAISKTQLSGDLSLVAGAAFGQYFLMSVPASDSFNSHTWVLNNSSMESLTDSSGPSWCGIWTGTRPVVWMTGVIAGQNRIYFLSKDYDGNNRLWEAFTPDRTDNGCPITWAAELRSHFGQTMQGGNKRPAVDCSFRYAEFSLTGLEDTTDVGVFFAGGQRGAYKQCLSKQLAIARGSLDSQTEIGMDTAIFAFKPQTRRMKTRDVGADPTVSGGTGSCPVESKTNEDIDESFQIMIVGHGAATLRWINTTADLKITSEQSEFNEACDPETPIRAVQFDGTGALADSLEEAVQKLSESVTNYTSNQTAVLTVDGISATGTGYAESIVSQAAADRVAQRIALKTAEAEILPQLPHIFSAGATD